MVRPNLKMLKTEGSEVRPNLKIPGSVVHYAQLYYSMLAPKNMTVYYCQPADMAQIRTALAVLIFGAIY